jgi:serine/threonine protein kinase
VFWERLSNTFSSLIAVFDFGLAKSLSPELKKKDNKELPYGYNLTPRTGSVPYMAPEVADCRPYDCQCDVFSFSILLWEMLSLKPAYRGISRREFLERVVRNQERLPLKKNWPPLTRLMIVEAWDHRPEKRPDMKRVAAMLRGDLNEMTSDTSIRQRTQHMRERSAHSTHLSRAFSKSLLPAVQGPKPSSFEGT